MHYVLGRIGRQKNEKPEAEIKKELERKKMPAYLHCVPEVVLWVEPGGGDSLQLAFRLWGQFPCNFCIKT